MQGVHGGDCTNIGVETELKLSGAALGKCGAACGGCMEVSRAVLGLPWEQGATLRGLGDCRGRLHRGCGEKELIRACTRGSAPGVSGGRTEGPRVAPEGGCGDPRWRAGGSQRRPPGLGREERLARPVPSPPVPWRPSRPARSRPAPRRPARPAGAEQPREAPRSESLRSGALCLGLPAGRRGPAQPPAPARLGSAETPRIYAAVSGGSRAGWSGSWRPASWCSCCPP